MRRLRKFADLSAAERRLLISAACLLTAIRIGLVLLPFQSLRGLLGRYGRPPADRRSGESPAPDRIAWAVATASRVVPGAASCLPRALAAQALLARHGYSALLHIGVADGDRKRLEAHAWVELKGEIVLGEASAGRFTPLPLPEVESR